MELQINAHAEHLPYPAEIAGTSEVNHHVHESGVATGGLGIVARLRSASQSAQIKLIEVTPALAPFLETQAACACKAGCPSCAGPTIAAPLWAATKDWASRKFSRSESSEDQSV